MNVIIKHLSGILLRLCFHILKGKIMLHVPEITTGSRPIDPDLQSLIAPSQDQNQNQTSIADADTVMDILDVALVKNIITRLHQEEEKQFQALKQYSESQIAELVDDHRTFLKTQKDIHCQTLTTNHRKNLFEFMTKTYFRQSINRAEKLRQQKIHEFHVETIKAQNQEFLNRALLPENALNDEAQTAYRNMILFNLETLHQDLPKAERDKILDDAAAILYEKIIEKRLEIAPEATAALLEADSVARVLGAKTVQKYRRQAAELKKDTALRRRAAAYVDEGLTPEQAKGKAENEYPEDRESLLRHYKELRYCDNRKLYLTRILNMETVWRDLMKNEGNKTCIPVWVRNTDSALYSAILENLVLRERHGGLPPDPDYAMLLDFAGEFDPYVIAERFRDENELYRFITGLGGPDAPAFQAALRMLLGKAAVEDRTWFGDLSKADAALAEQNGGERLDKGERQERLRRFDVERGIALERGSHDKLTEMEVAGLLS